LGDRWNQFPLILEEGLKKGVYTAAVALVGLKGDLLWEGAAGRVSLSPEAPAVTENTVFDLASLTKPLATTLALMVLAARGRIKVDNPLGEVLPHSWLPRDKRGLALKALLAHRAGLPAWRPFYQEVLAAPLEERPTLLERLAAAAALEYTPDSATVYSDLGFMLLKAVVEAAAGENLDAFCRREIFRPLGLEILGFNPLKHPGAAARSFAATETGLIPERNISGEVHDENAWAAGGLAGHAGLFGRGREVFSLIAALYRAYQGEAGLPFSPATVRRFLTPLAPGARALGFDVPSAEAAQCSAGRYFSPRSMGHTGFTGTSFWLDLELGQMVVLLTNRVHRGRDNLEGIRAFRPRFHEAASAALGFNNNFRS
jgi:CubicO group peptidase (beta-lactamase class C family)